RRARRLHVALRLAGERPLGLIERAGDVGAAAGERVLRLVQRGDGIFALGARGLLLRLLVLPARLGVGDLRAQLLHFVGDLLQLLPLLLLLLQRALQLLDARAQIG